MATLTVPTPNHPPGQRSLRKAISFESVSSLTALIPLLFNPPVAQRARAEVTDPRRCPNPKCKNTNPHIWISAYPIPPRPSNLPELELGRFGERSNPYPQRNHYRLLAQPPRQLADGQRVYTPLYGIVELQETNFLHPRWREFHLLETQEGDKRHVASLLVKNEWCCAMGEPAPPKGMLSRLCCF